MKISNRMKWFLLAAAAVAFASPVYAGNGGDDPPSHISGGHGADDPPGDDRGRGVGLEPGDDHGNHQVIPPAGDLDNTSHKARLDDNPQDDSSAKGKITHRVRDHGGKEEFSVQLKLRFPDPALELGTAGAASNAEVFAAFRDGAGAATSECRFEFDEIDRRRAEYQVKLVRKGATLREKEGACDIDLTNAVADPGIPAPQGGTAEIYVNTATGRKTVATLFY
jgi:hypothetical protein